MLKNNGNVATEHSINMASEDMVKETAGAGARVCPVTCYDVDFRNILKPSALLNMLQEAAALNAERLGFGTSFTGPRNYGWFLVKYHFEFSDYPQNLNQVLIKTEARGTARILAHRDFEVRDGINNKILGRVASVWMMVGLDTKNVVNVSKELSMPVFKKRKNDLSFEKINELGRIDFCKQFEIRFEDIDLNQHVNNANYIVWAFETLPYEFKLARKLKKMDVIYKKEVSFGADICSEAELDVSANISVHSIKVKPDGDELCRIKAHWEPVIANNL